MSDEDKETRHPVGAASDGDEAARLWGRYVDTQKKRGDVAEKMRVSWLVVGFALGFFVLLAGLAIVALG